MRKNMTAITFFTIAFSQLSLVAQEKSDKPFQQLAHLSSLVEKGDYKGYYQHQAYEIFVKSGARLPNVENSANNLADFVGIMDIDSLRFRELSEIFESDGLSYFSGYEALYVKADGFGTGCLETPILFVKPAVADTWKFFYLDETTLPRLKKIIPLMPANFPIPPEKNGADM